MTLLAIVRYMMVLMMGPFPHLSNAAFPVALYFSVLWQISLFWWMFAVVQLTPT